MGAMKGKLEDTRYLYWLTCLFLAHLICLPLGPVALGQGNVPQRSEPGVWKGPDGSLLPFENYDELEQYLSTAIIVEAEEIGSGITKPKKVLLEKNGIRMNAIFRDIDSFRHRWESPKGMRLDFHDYHAFECAAYRLSKILGMGHVPPVVPRTLRRQDVLNSDILNQFENKTGSLQAWVEDAMSDRERREEGLRPPDIKEWAYQFQMMTLFDNLIFNYDRNQTNILIGPEWKIWFIDATRSFPPDRDLLDTGGLTKCERTVWKRLQALDEESVRVSLGELLNNRQLEALLARREKLISYIQGLIDERGEKLVLFDEAELDGD